ncbi:MAG: hypothetical protein A2Z14_18120 [Chloroflexi bacterium RBG_16_48_8]|nr:MAG: hypothetical protein A2Z14_18120 [Chloroflexi bacterium RBG_16_48_8]
MSITEFILLVLSVAILDLIVVLWLRKRGRSTDSSPKATTPGKLSRLFAWLKYRKPPEKQLASQEKERQGIGGGSVEGTLSPEKPTIRPLLVRAASFLKSFPGSKLQFPAGEWIDILVITFVTFLYAYPVLVSHPGLGLPGREYQAHVGSAVLFNQWLAGETDFPLWNPVLGTGRSLIADPFIFFFNPFLSLPMAIFGVINGSKVVVLLNFFMAGLGMWFLGRELKFGQLTRLWCSLLYMMSGAIPAHLNAGHIQLAFALGWLPWSIAGMLWVINRSSLASVLLASLAQALFFFTGNLYYQIYAFFCLLILSFGFAFDWKQFHFKWEIAKRILLMAFISLGLISIQFLPELASISDVRNLGGYLPDETEYYGSQRPENALVNYFVSDMEFYRNPTLDKAPYPQESYRYIGVMPFLLLFFLIPAYQRGHKKEILVFGLCFFLMLAWTDIRFSFIKTIYNVLPFLNQFRWPGRALSVGALFLIVLSAYCLDSLWASIRFNKPLLKSHSASDAPGATPQTYSILSILLILGLFLSIRHVYLKNQELIYLENASEPEIKVGLAFLRNNDPSEFSVYASHAIVIKSALDIYKNHLRSPTIVDGWVPGNPPLLLGDPGAIKLEPRYWLNWEGEDIDHTNHNLVASIGSMQIWQKPDTYPYAFLVPIQHLLSVDQIPPGEVQPVTDAQRDGTNRIVVEVESDQENVLILSESWFSGWRVSIDHHPAEIVSVSNLLAVQISPGRHVVEFEYSPLAFKVGAPISVFTLLFITLAFLREGLMTYVKNQMPQEI